MDTKLLARIAAIAFVAIAITLTMIEMRDPPATAPEPSMTVTALPAANDPLVVELTRCQSIGQAGASDTACLRAWAENRRRFLAPGARPEAALPAVQPAGVAAGAEN